MRSFIDTNLFVYATFPDFPQFQKARDFLKSCLEGSDSYCLGWSVVYEYLRVVTHPRLFSSDPLEFSKALENILRFSSARPVEILQETEEHSRILEQLAGESHPMRGNILHDAHHVVLMREHDIRRIYTADSELHHFRGIEAVNPLLNG